MQFAKKGIVCKTVPFFYKIDYLNVRLVLIIKQKVLTCCLLRVFK